jgi:hypothetical protein
MQILLAKLLEMLRNERMNDDFNIHKCHSLLFYKLF